MTDNVIPFEKRNTSQTAQLVLAQLFIDYGYTVLADLSQGLANLYKKNHELVVGTEQETLTQLIYSNNGMGDNDIPGLVEFSGITYYPDLVAGMVHVTWVDVVGLIVHDSTQTMLSMLLPPAETEIQPWIKESIETYQGTFAECPLHLVYALLLPFLTTPGYKARVRSLADGTDIITIVGEDRDPVRITITVNAGRLVAVPELMEGAKPHVELNAFTKGLVSVWDTYVERTDYDS